MFAKLNIQILASLKLLFIMHFLLVIEYNVGPPDVVGRHVKHLHPAVVVGIPGQLVVIPRLGRVTTRGLWSGSRHDTTQRLEAGGSLPYFCDNIEDE